MLFKIISTGVCLLLFCANSFASNSNEEEATLDALHAIELFIQMDDVLLYALPHDDDFINEKCMLTNQRIENIIRAHALRFEGGQSRRAIARTLDRFVATFISLIDEVESKNISKEDMKKLKLSVMQNNSLFALFCFFSEYRYVSRK